MYLNNADIYAVWLQIKLMFVPKVQSLECIQEHTMAHLNIFLGFKAKFSLF